MQIRAIIVIIFFCTPAFGGQLATRPLDQIMNYSLHGVSLDMKIDQARKVLEEAGFQLDNSGETKGHVFWEYSQDNVNAILQKHIDGQAIRKITFVHNAKKESPFDVDAEAKRIEESWGQGEDGKPVCHTREGDVKGKAIYGECAVMESPAKKAVYDATIIRKQLIEGLSNTEES